MGVRKQGSKTVRIRPRGCSLREHPIAGSSSCATRSEGHLAREIAEGFVASAPSQPSAPSAKGEVAGRPLFIPGPVNEVSSDVPEGGQPQTFSTLKCGWRQSWGWLATTSAIWGYAENIYSLRALPLVTLSRHLHGQSSSQLHSELFSTDPQERLPLGVMRTPRPKNSMPLPVTNPPSLVSST